MNMVPSFKVIYLLFFITRQCGYYDLRYSSDIVGVMEIEIYRIIVLKLRIFYPELQDSLTCYAFSCPILPSGWSLQVFLKVTDVSSREDSGRLCSTEIFSVLLIIGLCFTCTSL